MASVDLVFLHAPSVYDFRNESILYGPISDLVPSTPVFEMYPIGFTTMADYLERHGFRVRIINLAVRMVKEAGFNAERLISRLNPAAFGIDLHWLPHAHGSLAVADLVKKHHPNTPVVFGGFSASYYHEELIRYPQVDYVIRGDSAEEPIRRLMQALRGHDFGAVPNLTWKDASGQVHVNPQTYVPDDLDHVMIDYSYVLRTVLRYRDLASTIPFKHWLDYPITAALSCRGCTYGCKTCGGSARAFSAIHGRSAPAYRAPETLAQDIRDIGKFSRGPVFVLGDIRQAGMEYAERFLRAVKGVDSPLILELFEPASREFLNEVAASIPGWTLEFSLESHDDKVRRAFGRPYSTADAERTLVDALEAGCRRLDVFFMTGLPEQDYASVLGTAHYCGYLMRDLNRGSDRRLIPFISPLAPFLDPGSEVFENPGAYGYTLRYHTLEEHRRALVQPSWKYVLNYETRWMNRDEIVSSTYEAGLRLNAVKAEVGIVPRETALATDRRIHKAMRLIEQIDDIMGDRDAASRQRRLAELKPEVDSANLSTVCEKSELELPMGWAKLNFLSIGRFFVERAWRRVIRSASERKAELCAGH